MKVAWKFNISYILGVLKNGFPRQLFFNIYTFCGNTGFDTQFIKFVQVVGTSANLTLDVDRHTAGRYSCKATVIGFPEIGAEATVYLKGPPTITSHRVQFGIQGDNVRLECLAYSIPKPEHIVWTFRGNEVDANDKDYTILEDPLPEGIKSTLVIRDSQEQHFGAYNCSVSNPYGSDMVEIVLKPQSEYYFLLQFLILMFGLDQYSQRIW